VFWQWLVLLRRQPSVFIFFGKNIWWFSCADADEDGFGVRVAVGVKVVHAHWLLFFLNLVRLAATCDRSFSVLQYQITKNRSAANLDLINLIISGPDAEQRASKNGVYAPGIGANGQKMTPA